MTFIEAVARMEGFGPPENRQTRNNNPGDIEFHPGGIAEKHGATKGDPRFAVFPTVEQGWECLRSLFIHNYAGLTVREAVERFAPMTENNSYEYLYNVCEWAKLHSNDTLSEENIG